MYARTVSDKTLNFTVSGMLWNRSLVMMDVETRTAWSHILGRGMQGELRGAELEVLPGILTDWETWRREHPETTVAMLSRTAREYRREFYRDPSRFVLGLTRGEMAVAYPFDVLMRSRVANDALGDDALVVFFDAASVTAFSYSPRLGDDTLRFEWDGEHFVDTKTRSRWNPSTGMVTEGTSKGKRLTPMPGIVSFRRIWKSFHPGTREWGT